MSLEGFLQMQVFYYYFFLSICNFKLNMYFTVYSGHISDIRFGH